MPSESEPILLEVLANVPTDFFHCSHCEQIFNVAGIGAQVHTEIQASYPPEMLEEADQLSAWLQDLSARYGKQLHIRVVDAQSLEGFLKSLRYWVRQYPAFIINRNTRYIGWEAAVLDRMLGEQGAQRIAQD
jgi:hypothetical protein